jgi:branched-chain amino acid transport system permease protein
VVEQLGSLTVMIEIPGARAMVLCAFLLGVLLIAPQGIFVRKAALA